MYLMYFWIIVSYAPLQHPTVYQWVYAGTYQNERACDAARFELPGLAPENARCVKAH